MMIDCIIKHHQGIESAEHIIPDGLGGRLIMTRVCVTCNNTYCSSLDAVLVDDPIVRFPRFEFKTPGYESVAKRLFGPGTLPDGTNVVVQFDEQAGIFKAIPKGQGKTVIDNGDGTAQITWNLGDDIPTPERLLNIVNRELRKRGEQEITLDQLSDRVTTKIVEVENPEVNHRFVSDMIGINLAGLKIAYEFTVDTLGDQYLSDPLADQARDLIIAGIPASDLPNRATYDAMGRLAPAGDESPLRELPASTHVLFLTAVRNDLVVLVRIFNVYEGYYILSKTASRYLTDGAGRVYSFDVVSKMKTDSR